MTALARLFRATAFKLTLAILGLSAVGAGSGARRRRLAGDQARRRGDAADDRGGGQRPRRAIRAGRHPPARRGRSRRARASRARRSICSPTPPASRSPAISASCRPACSTTSASSTRPIETLDDAERRRRALARIFALPGGFRLLVGHDLGDRARIGAVMVRALAISLIFLAGARRARRAVRRPARAAAHRRDEPLGARDHGRRSHAAPAGLGLRRRTRPAGASASTRCSRASPI